MRSHWKKALGLHEYVKCKNIGRSHIHPVTIRLNRRKQSLERERERQSMSFMLQCIIEIIEVLSAVGLYVWSESKRISTLALFSARQMRLRRVPTGSMNSWSGGCFCFCCYNRPREVPITRWVGGGATGARTHEHNAPVYWNSDTHNWGGCADVLSLLWAQKPQGRHRPPSDSSTDLLVKATSLNTTPNHVTETIQHNKSRAYWS